MMIMVMIRLKEFRIFNYKIYIIITIIVQYFWNYIAPMVLKLAK